MGLWHFRRFSALFLAIGALVTVTIGSPNRAQAQEDTGPGCLRIVGAQAIDDRTLAVALAVRTAHTDDIPVHGKLHLYTASSQYIVNVERTPGSIVFRPAPEATPNPLLRAVPPVVVKIDSAVSDIKGMILEAGTTGGACRMSEWVMSPQRPTAPVRSDILAQAHDVPPLIAPPARPVTLECPVPFALPHVIQAAPVTAPMGQRVTGTVLVLVDLDVTGHVTNASIKKTLSATLDAVAIEAAKESTYSPLLVACVSQPTSYIFAVLFK